MSDAVNYTEIYSQHVELLPGRTLLQTTGGVGDVGGGAQGGVGINVLSGIGVLGTGSASASDAIGGLGGSANG